MKRTVYNLFGVLPLLVVDETEYEVVESEEPDTPSHLGGSAHNFTLAEQFVDERYEPWDEGNTIGFRRPL